MPGPATCALAARALRYCLTAVNEESYQYSAIARVAGQAETFADGGDIGAREVLDAREALKLNLGSSSTWGPVEHALFGADWAAVCCICAGRAAGYPLQHVLNSAVNAAPQCEESLLKDIETVRHLCKVQQATNDTPFPTSVFESKIA